ncbi:MAG TPA: amino acid ABC transporter ATP-binding protein [Sphingomicrobium sp.]|nr:amino acid ABC transporter ATP-binding protein [Sphingomicrobium sp.]
MAILEVNNLVKSYGGKAILDGVSFALEEGEAKVIMGPSGCGKSTLLRCLNLLIEPTSGAILFEGQDVTRPGTDVRALRSRIGFVFQNFALYRHMSVLDNVALSLRKLKKIPRREAEERALHELDRMEMADKKDAYPAALSGGQSQRVAIARALAMDPRVLFFDEPTSALDPIMVREVVTLINRLYLDNVTILCVTHDLSLAKHISDRVVFLDRGKVHAEDNIESLLARDSDPVIDEFFCGDD